MFTGESFTVITQCSSTLVLFPTLFSLFVFINSVSPLRNARVATEGNIIIFRVFPETHSIPYPCAVSKNGVWEGRGGGGTGCGVGVSMAVVVSVAVPVLLSLVGQLEISRRSPQNSGRLPPPPPSSYRIKAPGRGGYGDAMMVVLCWVVV